MNLSGATVKTFPSTRVGGVGVFMTTSVHVAMMNTLTSLCYLLHLFIMLTISTPP